MSYTTIQGDTWDMISHKIYGNAIYAHIIMEANPAYLSIVVFSAGTVLSIPDAPITTAPDLPPWKRGGA